jgi:carboxypeptidase PM20D1
VPFPKSAILANARALGPVFFAAAGGSPETAALMRTTVAMTMLQGSPADNVLPSEAKAILNLRLLPGWTIDESLAYVEKRIDDPRVTVKAYSERAAHEPTAAAPGKAEDDAGWDTLTAAVSETFPDAAILPFLVTAMTDSRHYAPVCRSIYRFSPITLNPQELGRIHGHDERISIENFIAGITFYRRLISSL